MDPKKNLGLKITAVIISLGLWTWVKSQGDVLQTMDIPVPLDQILPADLVTVGNVPDQISVRLRGPDLAFRTLSPGSVRVSLAQYRDTLAPGSNRLPLSAADVKAPAGITVDRVSPTPLEITLERRDVREIPVVPAIEGEPAPGFEVAGTVVQPPRLTVEGPAPAMETLDSVTTSRVSIAGLSESATFRAVPLLEGEIKPRDPNVTVEVRVRIRPVTVTRSITGAPIVAEGYPLDGPQPTLEPARAEIEITGPQTWVSTLSAESFVVVADLAGLLPEPRDLTLSELVVRPADPGSVPGEEVQIVLTGPERVQLTWTALPAAAP